MKQSKDTRLEVIKMIISNQELATQEELITELFKAGFPVTQATLSRDLRQLHIVKAQNAEGRYVYMLPTVRIYRTVEDNRVSLNQLNKAGVTDVKFSSQIAVLHTLPGHAPHVAYDLDNAALSCVLGTVAGDDTVFVALADGTEREEAMAMLSQICKKIG